MLVCPKEKDAFLTNTPKGHTEVTAGSPMDLTHGKCLMISVMSKTKYPTDSPRAALET